eukprot:s946_g2.t1
MLGAAPFQDSWQLRKHGTTNRSNIAPAALERALPDFNCHRVQGRRWRSLREDFEKLLGVGPTGVRSESAREFKLRWRRGVRRLALHHGFGHGSHPAAANFSMVALRRSCPLGAATLALAELLSSLLRFVEFHRRHTAGREVQDVEARLHRASQDFSSSLSLVRRPWLLVFLLPATRWPVLDLLLSMERHVLSSPTATAQCMQGSSQPSGYGYEALQPLLQRVSHSSWGDDSAAAAPKVHGFIGSNEVSELLKRAVHELSSQQYAFVLQQGERCRPLAMQQRMVTGLVLLETNVPIAGADPEAWFREMDEELRDFVASQDLWQRLVGMPFATYPFFGFWLRLRRLLTHRLDLPFDSVAQLADLFSVALKPARQGGHAATSADMAPWVTAFERPILLRVLGVFAAAASRQTSTAPRFPMTEESAQLRVRNLAGNLLLQLTLPESLEELKERASAVCGMPPGLLRFVKDNEPLKSLEEITGGDMELMMMVDESPYYSWDIAGNPDSHFLTGSDTTVEFTDVNNMSDQDYVNVLSQVPIQQGVHFVEFIMHSLQDEQWCGVTFFPSRAGCRGGDVPGCFYYSGRRSHGQGALDLIRERNHRMTFAHVKRLLLDADRGAALFSLNGAYQGGCRLPRCRPMYFCTALDCYEDSVELFKRPWEEFPVRLEDVMDTPQFLNEDIFQKEDWEVLEARKNPHCDPWISDWPDDSPEALEQLKAKTKRRNAVVIAAMCWGQRMAQRLRLWLRAARKADFFWAYLKHSHMRPFTWLGVAEALGHGEAQSTILWPLQKMLPMYGPSSRGVVDRPGLGQQQVDESIRPWQHPSQLADGSFCGRGSNPGTRAGSKEQPALQHFYVFGQYGGAVPRSHCRVVATACTWTLQRTRPDQ